MACSARVVVRCDVACPAMIIGGIRVVAAIVCGRFVARVVLRVLLRWCRGQLGCRVPRGGLLRYAGLRLINFGK